MGRPQKSPARHFVEGTRSRVADKPSGFVAGRPRFPSYLSPDAKRAFKRAVAILEARQTLTEGDETLLALYATVFERWLEAKRDLVGKLMIDVPLLDGNGQVHFVKRVNPLLKIATDCEARLLTIAKTLGLSPTDRERSKQTVMNQTDTVIPGSMEDLIRQSGEVLAFVPAPPPTSEDENDSE